ncbi:MAG TPA: hypothetical protein P5076_00755 [Myxococcota bacterium]|nr:hypothetical protein [Myxococcota bacterium]
MACGVPLEVKVEHAGGWPAGAYILEVDQDGVVGSCEFSSPPACEGWQPVCNPVRGWELDLDDCIEPYTGQTLRIAFGGWGAPEPASVTVRVSLDGVEIGAETFVPTYERFRPNGPDCDPVCQRADPVTLTLQ